MVLSGEGTGRRVSMGENDRRLVEDEAAELVPATGFDDDGLLVA